MPPDLNATIAELIGQEPLEITPLTGGSVAEVYKVTFTDRPTLVAKLGEGLELEARMLGYLGEKSNLPVPEVLHTSDELLLMSYISYRSSLSAASQTHAADLLTELHSITAPQFGFAWDSVIGGLAQPNPTTDNWCEFFRDHRLLYMAGQAHRQGRLPDAVLGRIEEFCGHLSDWIPGSAQPSLIHGDMWGGNILCQGDKVAGFVDPAIYFADAEIELAFSTLFSTFGEAFFARYQEHRPIAPGFFEERRDIYNLYPLLVHVNLFGGSYITSVETTLKRFGY